MYSAQKAILKRHTLDLEQENHGAAFQRKLYLKRTWDRREYAYFVPFFNDKFNFATENAIVIKSRSIKKYTKIRSRRMTHINEEIITKKSFFVNQKSIL